MFLVTEAALRWRRRAFVLLLLIVGSYVWYRLDEPFPHGGSFAGLTYGIVATILIGWLILYAVRKRAHKSRLGTLEGWAQAHVYIGLLVPVLVLLHSGFRFQDRLAVSTMVVLMLVIVTGFAGTVLYTVVPRMLTEVGSDPPPSEIGDQLRQLERSMRRLCRDRSEEFTKVHDHLVAEAKPQMFAAWRLIGGDPLRGVRRRRERRQPQLRALLASVPEQDQDILKRLMVQVRQHQELHRQLMSQQRYRNLLKSWLYLHVPLTAGLVVLLVCHIIAASFFS